MFILFRRVTDSGVEVRLRNFTMPYPSFVWLVLCMWGGLVSPETLTECPSSCACLGMFVDCSKRNLLEIPKDLPTWTENLDLRDNAIMYIDNDAFEDLKRLKKLELSANRLTNNATSVLKKLIYLNELKINKNHLTEIPPLEGLVSLVTLTLSHNDITSLNPDVMEELENLKFLDLNNNLLSEIKRNDFSKNVHIQILNLNSNQIGTLEKGCMDMLQDLIELKLNRNQLSELPKDVFKHPKQLQILELNKNKFMKIEGLSFSGLESLHTLRLQRNSISSLQDGSFWGLKNLSTLQLDYNNITSITKSWLYGLGSLTKLTLSHNRIVNIDHHAWESCGQLLELNISNNKLNAIRKDTFQWLGKLKILCLDNNLVEYIAEGAFNNTPSLEVLELNFNRISWTIDDMNGVFIGLSRLGKFGLASNLIKTLNAKAFIGLEKMRTLDLKNNNITSIQENAFAPMPLLSDLLLNTESLICDCHIKWFPAWLRLSSFKSVSTSCAFPEWLKGKSVTEVALVNLTCDEFPKPHILEHPKTQTALRGNNVTLYCKASSSSVLPMTFQWRKDNIDLETTSIKRFVKSSEGRGTEQSSEFTLINITQSEAGKYQCIVSNSYGTTYSLKSKLSIYVYPVFEKIPGNITVKSGSTARLECAATGSPSPQISWRKDGGNDFPAARERRMHVMPTDDVFFIISIKIADMGVYSCTAWNAAGSIIANASLTVLESPSLKKRMENKEAVIGSTVVLQCIAQGSPKPKVTWRKDGSHLVTTERHFFTADDQRLVIVHTTLADAGRYECEMSNPLGTEKGYSQLSIIPEVGQGVVDNDITGIIIITVVCCAVGTSVIWVVIIYQTRKRMGLVEMGTESCQYPSTLLPSNLSSAPHLYLDTNSEHSSSKDSGTGDSAKRSSDDLLLENGLSVNTEGGSNSNMEATNHLLPKQPQSTHADAAPVPILRSSLHTQRTDHDRFSKVRLLCGSYSQRWSVPHCVEMAPNHMPSSCSYRSLPVNLQVGIDQDNASQLEGVEDCHDAAHNIADV